MDANSTWSLLLTQRPFRRHTPKYCFPSGEYRPSVLKEGAEKQDEDRPDDLEIEALLDDLEEIEETSESHEQRRVIRRTIETLDRFSGGRIFSVVGAATADSLF